MTNGATRLPLPSEVYWDCCVGPWEAEGTEITQDGSGMQYTAWNRGEGLSDKSDSGDLGH